MVQLGEPSQLFATPSRADGDSFIVTRTAGFRSGSPGLLGVLHQGWQWSGAFSTPASRCRPLLPAPGPVSPCGRPATRGAHSPPLISWLTRAHHWGLQVFALAAGASSGGWTRGRAPRRPGMQPRGSSGRGFRGTGHRQRRRILGPPASHPSGQGTARRRSEGACDAAGPGALAPTSN